MSTGSLGQGVSAAVGMALAGKMDGRPYRVYTLLGDGELQEGQVWEAAMFAGNRHLDNLLWIVDANGLQIDGTVDEVCSLEPLKGKFEAFHFHVIEAAKNPVLSNMYRNLYDLLEISKQYTMKPTEVSDATVMDHEAILDKMESGNADEASRYMKFHLSRAMRKLNPEEE